MKIQILLLLLPGWGAASSNDVHHSEIKEIEVDPTCTSADGSCMNDDIAKEVGMVASATAASEKVAEICEDKHDSCSSWASSGECEANPGYMLKYCRLSCEVCPTKVYTLEELGQGVDLGVAQIAKTNVAEALEKARVYIESDEVRKIAKGIKDLCKNENEMCAVWALAGECEKNPKYMKKRCAPMCHTCEMLTLQGRCPIDPEAPDAWGPGDLDKMFLKLTAEPYLSEYNVQIYSSPFDEEGGPWLITLDNVVKDEEAERLIELGAVEGYKRSSSVGKLNPDGTFEKKISEGRTSTNAWCKGPCYEDEMAQRVIHRLSNLTGINETNSDFLQLLRYEEDQFYNLHHDYISHHLERQVNLAPDRDVNSRNKNVQTFVSSCHHLFVFLRFFVSFSQQGVRILTFFLYLNDVEEGGGTYFDKVKNTTVTPKRGRAALWPSVMNDDPNVRDDRTTHQAMPVIKGIKYGANAWFHLRDFKTPFNNSCI